MLTINKVDKFRLIGITDCLAKEVQSLNYWIKEDKPQFIESSLVRVRELIDNYLEEPKPTLLLEASQEGE